MGRSAWLRPALGAAAAVAMATTAAACGDEPDDGRQRVAAGFYPLEFVAERVGGQRVDVVTLTAPGVEPHDLELDPGQVDEVQTADVVLYAGGGFQPAVEAATRDAEGRVVDVLEAVEVIGGDPHVWLDPVRMQDVARAVAGALSGADPDGTGAYQDGAARLVADLEALDAELRDGLARCDERLLVTTHGAFAYLADRYGLEQASITGIEPGAEADPARIAELADLVEDRGVTTVFTEELLPADLAVTVAAEVGAATAVLSPLEGEPEDGGDYLSAMRENLAVLRDGLGCGP